MGRVGRDGINYDSDYYGILEIGSSATNEAIKEAYRILARKFHPDLNNGSQECTEKLKLINEAFSILNNPEKKSKYDVRWGPKAPKTNHKKSKKQEAAEKAAARARYSPFNYTIDIEVGEVDLWNQTPRKPSRVEEVAAEHEKRVQEERRKKMEEKAAERRRQEVDRRAAELKAKRYEEYQAWKMYESYQKPVNKRKREGWYDVFVGEYVD